MIKKIRRNLKELGFSHNEIKVYIALTQLGEAKASEIAKKADLPRTTIISILDKLRESNYITTHRYKGITYYWIESPKILANILEHKINIANNLGELLSDLYRTETHFPVAQIYDTKNGIGNFIKKALTSLRKKSYIYTIDALLAGNYTKIFSDNARDTVTKIKRDREITTYTLIPYNSFNSITQDKISKQNIIIREMPEDIKFRASLWIIDDFIAHFSGNPPFLVTIKHEKIVFSIKSLFDFLWSISRPKN